MKYIKLLWFDIKRGLIKKPSFFGIPVIAALIACFDLNNRVAGLNNFDYFSTKTQASFADYIMYIYGGMDKYVPDSGNPFVFPVRWGIVFLSAAFLTLNYPYQDMQTCGQQILIRTKGRMTWWLAKCGWNITCVFVYHGLLFLTAALFGAAVQADFGAGLNKDLIYAVFRVGMEHMTFDNTPGRFEMLLIPILVSLGINLFQMTLSLFIKPMFSFFVTAFLMISSAYFTSPYLVGNYAMPLRYDVIITDGVSAKIGVIFSLVLIILVVIAGSIRFHRYDILNRN